VKELTSIKFITSIEFHTYKPKREKSFMVVLKHMSPKEKIDAIKRDIEELGLKVINIKKCGIKVPLNMFYVELKPENNNKDIYEATHVLL